MKRLILLIALFSYQLPVWSAGGATHIFIAELSRGALPDSRLKQLLIENEDAFFIGSNYPDTGYLPGANYGEITHWDPFIDAATDYINEKYPNAIETHPKLIAFLMGIASHRVSDEVWHWTFINHLADKDFGGDWDKAHSHADIGFDMIIHIDKKRLLVSPNEWWIPLDDLLMIYERMEHKVGRDEIEQANHIYKSLMVLERVGAPFLYPYYKLRMSWGRKHYQDDEYGGFKEIESEVAAYLQKTWRRFE